MKPLSEKEFILREKFQPLYCKSDVVEAVEGLRKELCSCEAYYKMHPSKKKEKCRYCKASRKWFGEMK